MQAIYENMLRFPTLLTTFAIYDNIRHIFLILWRLYEKSFTLAEVLITLGIIGVVAAMTIPTLISNYQKKEYVARL